MHMRTPEQRGKRIDMTVGRSRRITTDTAPRVSLITVVLNAPEDFRRTRLSIGAQKPNWLEWLVIDGGSTDGTLAEIKQADNLIDSLISERDGGIYDAMNKGARAAKGDFLWYMNAGDEIFPDALAHLSEVVGAWSADAIYCAPWVVRFPDGSETLRHPAPEELTFRMSVGHQATIHSKKALLDASMYDERYQLAADFDFFLKARLQGVPFHTLDTPLTRYYKGGRTDQAPISSKIETILSLWRSNSREKWRGIFKYTREIRNVLRNSVSSRIPKRTRRAVRRLLHGRS